MGKRKTAKKRTPSKKPAAKSPAESPATAGVAEDIDSTSLRKIVDDASKAEDKGFGVEAGKCIRLPEFDGVRRAGIFTQAAEQASGHIDVEHQGAAITLVILIGDDLDAIAGANLGA